LVDTEGLIITVQVTGANVPDHYQVYDLVAAGKQRSPRLKRVWVDEGYQGNPMYDAVGELMGLNRYSYVAGNPTNFVDPSGMIAETPAMWDNCFQNQNARNCSCYDNTNRNVPVAYGGGTTTITAREACQSGFIAYPECPPLATPIPTNTPRPTVTPQASNWTVPMQEACFSDIDYTTRAACTNQCIPSQDINRRIPSEYPVLAPANGEVMIVDHGSGVGDNADRGNFVAIRIAVDQIPSEVAARSSNIGTQGFLYIGYSHLSRIDVAVVTLVSSGQQLGMSGRTGLPQTDDNQPHLDLAMFFTPFTGSPTVFGLSAREDHNTFNALAFQQNQYPLGTKLPLDVKPSDLWPELAACP
jgi:hypothetical protein